MSAFIRSGGYSQSNGNIRSREGVGYFWANIRSSQKSAIYLNVYKDKMEATAYESGYGFSVRANRHAIMLAPGIHADEPSVKQIIPRVRCRRIRGSPKVAAILNDDATNSSIIKSASYEGYGSCKQKSFYKLLFAAEQRNPDRQGLLCYSG